MVFGTHNLASLPHLLQAVIEGRSSVEVLDASSSFPTELPTSREHSWAAWLPITIGCNNFCTYCIVPYVRGRGKIAPNRRHRRRSGTLCGSRCEKEITLLGQNVSSYGRDLCGSPRFAQILKALDETGVERLRFATSHLKRICPTGYRAVRLAAFIHAGTASPAQSGSDRIFAADEPSLYPRRIIDSLSANCAMLARISPCPPTLSAGFQAKPKKTSWTRLVWSMRSGISPGIYLFTSSEGLSAASMEDNTPHEVIQKTVRSPGRYHRSGSCFREKPA